MNPIIKLTFAVVSLFTSISLTAQTFIPAHAAQKNEYHNGPVFASGDSLFMYSDWEQGKYYQTRIQKGVTESVELNLQTKSTANGYLFGSAQKLYLITESSILSFTPTGQLISQIKLNLKQKGISCFPAVYRSGFRVIPVNSTQVVFQVSFVHSESISRNKKRYQHFQSLVLLDLNSGKGEFFNRYDSLISASYLPQFNLTRFTYKNDTLYTLHYFNQSLDKWVISDGKPFHSGTLKLSYPCRLPAQLEISKQTDLSMVNKQAIESDNLLDFSITDNGIYLFVSKAISDTTSLENSLSSQTKKKGCYVYSTKERNQWVQFYQKPVSCLKLNASGSLIKTTSVDKVMNDSEIIYFDEESVLFYNRSSQKETPAAIRFILRSEFMQVKNGTAVAP